MSFIDVFCGAGGFTEGLKMAGWNHVCGIELDKHAAATYAANNDNEVIVKDVREVRWSDLDIFLKKNNGGRRTIDALVGSPPCTSFSTAGPQRVGDERDDLYKEMMRLAKMLKPRVVVIENVVGMTSKKDPRRGNRSFADLVVEDMEAIGYKCQYKVLSALQFGVPQTRKRVIFIASKRPELIRFPDLPCVCAEDVPVKKYLDPPHRVADRFFLRPDKIAYFKTRKYTRYVDVDRAFPTIRAMYFKSQGEHGLITYDDGRVRMITDKEAARIQGFPKTFKFVGSLTQMYKQIGNAVAPPMAKGIGLALKVV